jgi:DNA-binding NarL/FixJ family response regulator
MTGLSLVKQSRRNRKNGASHGNGNSHGSGKKVRVFLVEENPLIAGALYDAVRNDASVQIITGKEVLAMHPSALSSEFCLFILDEGSLPEGLTRYLRHINNHIPDAGKIVLGRELAVDHIFRWLLEGANGFLCYRKARQELGKAIAAIARGGLWLAPERLEELCLYVQKIWGLKAETTLKFTQRQKQVIDMVQRKLSNKEIASALRISENTVKFHLTKVFSKSGTRSRSSLRELLMASGQ